MTSISAVPARLASSCSCFFFRSASKRNKSAFLAEYLVNKYPKLAMVSPANATPAVK
jgi:hypothetical protein